MKLIRLKIKNIASIEEAEICFNEGILSTASRFLICGDMGTGKSTILDSICLALYNSTPRLSQASDDKRNYGCDNVTAQDPRNLLRHGTKEGSVELDFEGSDGKIYKAMWACTRKKDHTLNKSTHTLTCGTETFGNKKEIAKRIQETAVGLDFQQFCRTTLLAQGQFTQFLKSKDNEKASILEKLTQTDIYSTIGHEISQISKDKDKEYSALDAEIKGAQLLTPDEIAELEQQIENCDSSLLGLQNQKNTLEEKLRWLTRLNDAERQREKTAEQLQRLKEVVESPDFQNESKLINDWNNSSDGRHLLLQIDEGQSKQKTFETDQIPKGKRQFEEASKMLNDLKDNLSQLQSNLAALQKQMAADEPHKEMYHNVQTVLAHLNNAQKHRNTKEQLTRKKKEAENQLPELKKAAQAAASAKEKCMKEVKRAQTDEQRMQRQLNELHPDELKKSNEENESQQQLLNTARQRCNDLKSLNESVLANEEELQKNRKAQSEEQDKIKQWEPVAEERKNELARAKELLEKTTLALGNAADTLRAQLHIGDICPVCGHTIDQLVDTAALRAAIEPQQQNVKEADKRLTEANSQIEAAKKMVEKYKKDIENLEAKKEELGRKQQAASGQAEQACLDIQLSFNQDVEKSLIAISEKEKEIQKQKKILLERQEQVNEQSKTIIAQQKAITELTEKEKEAELEAEKSDQRVKKCESNITAYEERIREEQDETAKELDTAEKQLTWNGWRDEWEKNPQSFTQKLQDSAKEFTEREKNSEKISKEIETQQAHLQDIEKNRNEILNQWSDWATDTDERLPGTDVAEKWQKLAQKTNLLHVMITECHKNLATNEEKLKQFLQQHPDLSRQRLEEIYKLSVTQDFISSHQQQEKAFEGAQSALKQADKVLEEVRQEKHPDIAADENTETLEAQKQTMEDEIKRLVSAKGNAQGRLNLNQQNEQTVTEKKQLLENLQHTTEQWKILSNMFGSNDGGAFRNVAQSFLLQNLVRSANEYLKELTQRYRLDCIPGTLTLSLRDLYQGEVESPVDTLSGGESFLVSLSLALALSSINRKGLNIDILFIDEGFGNLSSNELETVLNMLARLQKMNGKRVGIISHVDAVKEHIPVHIEVRRIDPTRSRIEVVDRTGK